MDLASSKQRFMELIADVKSEVLTDFLKWIQEAERFKCQDSSEIILEKIAEDIRKDVPFDAVLPSENITPPSVGKNSDCADEVTAHVDSFLYSDDYLDELVEEGKFSRNYCLSCGSRETKPLTFISHSASQASLKFLFKQLLPDISNKTLVDVGSRLGPVLYAVIECVIPNSTVSRCRVQKYLGKQPKMGIYFLTGDYPVIAVLVSTGAIHAFQAHLFTSCQRIVGIEINKELCDIQRNIIDKYVMGDRISVINSDIRECGTLLSSADVVIMNNVFEFFAAENHVLKLWEYVMETLKGPGKFLVTVPSLQESLEPLNMCHRIDAWVEEVSLNYDESNDDIEDMHLYKLR